MENISSSKIQRELQCDQALHVKFDVKVGTADITNWKDIMPNPDHMPCASLMQI